MKRTPYTRHAREELLARFRESGSRSPSRFAKENDVKPTTFAKWLAKARRREKERGTLRAPETVRFVAVEAAPMAIAPNPTVVELQVREVCLKIPAAAGAAFVAELVTLLAERRPC